MFINNEINKFSIINIDIKINTLLIREDDDFFKWWNIMIFGLMGILILYMPLQISEPSLADHPITKYVDLFFDIMFIIDMFINFCVPYTDANGQMVEDHGMIALAYLKSWFFIDLTSSLPVGFIVSLANSDSDVDTNTTDTNYPETPGSDDYKGSLIFLKIPRYYKFAKFAKLIRIFKALKYQHKLRDLLNNLNIPQIYLNTFMKTIVLILFSHIMTQNELNWFRVYTDDFTIFPEDSLPAKYILAWYFVIQTVTTVGYGDFVTVNKLEMFFKVILILIGIYLWTFVLATITEAQLENVIDNIQDRVIKDKIEEIGSQYRLGFKSQMLMDILLHTSNNFCLGNDYQMIVKLPEKQAKEVLNEIYDYLQSKISFFIDKPFDLFINFFSVLNLKFYGDNEYLWKYGDHLDKVFFISYGKVALQECLMQKYNMTLKGTFKIYEGDDIIGLDEGYIHDQNKYSAMSIDQSEIYYVDKIHFMYISLNFNYNNELYIMTKHLEEEYTITMIAIMLILHLFYIADIYLKNYEFYSLLYKYFAYSKNISPNNPVEMINEIEKFLFSYGINIDLAVEHINLGVYPENPWFYGFFYDIQYLNVINLLKRNYFNETKILYNFEKFMFPINFMIKDDYYNSFLKGFTIDQIIENEGKPLYDTTDSEDESEDDSDFFDSNNQINYNIKLSKKNSVLYSEKTLSKKSDIREKLSNNYYKYSNKKITFKDDQSRDDHDLSTAKTDYNYISKNSNTKKITFKKRQSIDDYNLSTAKTDYNYISKNSNTKKITFEKSENFQFNEYNEFKKISKKDGENNYENEFKKISKKISLKNAKKNSKSQSIYPNKKLLLDNKFKIINITKIKENYDYLHEFKRQKYNIDYKNTEKGTNYKKEFLNIKNEMNIINQELKSLYYTIKNQKKKRINNKYPVANFDNNYDLNNKLDQLNADMNNKPTINNLNSINNDLEPLEEFENTSVNENYSKKVSLNKENDSIDYDKDNNYDIIEIEGQINFKHLEINKKNKIYSRSNTYAIKDDRISNYNIDDSEVDVENYDDKSSNY